MKGKVVDFKGVSHTSQLQESMRPLIHLSKPTQKKSDNLRLIETNHHAPQMER
jgi:hypothetical protein